MSQHNTKNGSLTNKLQGIVNDSFGQTYKNSSGLDTLGVSSINSKGRHEEKIYVEENRDMDGMRYWKADGKGAISVSVEEETRSEPEDDTTVEPSGASTLKDRQLNDQILGIQLQNMQLYAKSANRDQILLKCKKAIETLTNEIERQKAMNSELQDQVQSYDHMVAQLQEQI